MTAGGTGSGGGSVSYNVAANATPQPRTGTLSLAGQVHTISQQGRPATECTYTVTPTTATYNKDAAEGTFAVTAPGECSWNATSSASWLTIVGGPSGAGSRQRVLSGYPQRRDNNSTATISVAGQTFTLRQAGDSGVCRYSVAPVDLNLCMAGGTVTTTVTAESSCAWTASPDASWLTVTSGSAGTGTALIAVTVPENYDAPRAGTILVRWPAPTFWVRTCTIAQAGCRYAVSKAAIAVPAGGGSSSFDVIQQSDPIECGGATQDRCVWSAVAQAPWLTITSSMPRSGDNPVAFTAASNPGPDARVGTITVRDKVVLITQAGK